ncbi:hypothetical protein ACFPLA_08600 [Brevibacterium otitidis]|nr:hypothetical protein GCM10023233_04990 [Brevibacterium otitidis]
MLQEWGERDRVLAEALIEFDSTAHCPGCGQLRSKAWDPDTAGAWETHEDVTCYACAHTAEQQKKKKSNDDEPTPGQLTYVSLNEEDVAREKKVRQARVRRTS